jgi:hypothetical protein
MFVYVRLIDSQEHQYPNKKPDPTIQEKPKNKILKNQVSKSKERPSPKTNDPKTVASFLNHSIETNKKSRSA